MNKTFQGRTILPAEIEGEALVTHVGFRIWSDRVPNVYVPSA